MKEQQFHDELIKQVPSEKRQEFRRIIAKQKYIQSRQFRFFFNFVLLELSLVIVSLIFFFLPELRSWFGTFLMNDIFLYLVPSFLVACLLGVILREMIFKFNQNGIHFIHACLILGVLAGGSYLGHFILTP